jgi:hypothetical protein
VTNDIPIKILAIDPGPTESAYVVWDGARIEWKGKETNADMLGIIGNFKLDHYNRCCIEMIASYGMAVGAEVFETCVWIGRFMEAFGPDKCDRIPRIQIKNHLCHSSRAKDANIRQALIDRLGPVGTKKSPGPLFGVSADIWSALAVAITWADAHAAARP